MRKNLLVLIALLCCLAGFSQGVVVSTTAYGNANATQLVNNVLVNNSCLVQTANITKSTGLSTYNYAQGNSIGSFTNSNSAFPMSAGVVLVSGDALTASGPNTSVSTDNSVASQTWLGDADLQTAFASIGGINSMNATVLEFDFTAVTSTLSIPYLFASEEYGQYQCNSKDGMAILIKPVGGTYTNIATLPDGSPVSVATIRNNSYNTACSSQNPAYFGTFNGGGNSSTAATNFEGQTVLMTATYTLVPGTTYHLKIVVADDGNANPINPAPTDGRYNSAVFLPAGGLNLGQLVMGQNMVAATNTALCQGGSYTINTQLNPADFTFNWTLGGSTVGTGASYTATQAGTYTLTITNPTTSCVTSEQVTLEFEAPLSPGTPTDLYSCPGSGGQYTYNLSTNTTTLLNGATATVSYHTSQADADAGTNPVNPIYNTTSTATTIIYARVKSTTSTCYSVVPFNLVPVTPPVANTASTLQACETTAGAGTAVFNLTAQTATVLGSQSASQYSVIYYTSLADANAGTNPITSPTGYSSVTTTSSPTQTIYARVQSSFNTTCYAVSSFTIQVNPLPAVTEMNDIQVCGSYTLPAVANGTYYSASGGNTPLPVGYVVTTSQTIYIYNTNASGCSNQSDFVVTVLTGAVTPSSVTACNSYTLPTLPAGQQYRTAANGGGVEIPGGTVVSSTYAYAAATDPDGNNSHVIYFYIPTAATCTNTSSFTVTLITVPNQADVTLCTGPYTLPALPGGGSYWTASGGPSGGGTQLTGNITTSQTIYIYNQHPDGSCYAETSFDVYIAPQVVPRSDFAGCGVYFLPAPSVGAYYHGSGGTGGQIANGTYLSTTQTVYIYYADDITGCTSEDVFEVVIYPSPDLPVYSNVTVCNSYTLPAAPAGYTIDGYYTSSNGSGTPQYMPGDVITSTMTLFAITPANQYGCRRARQFTITVLGANAQTPGNQTACGSYTLPSLAVGNYYTMAGGPATAGNVQKFAGDVITSTQTLYVYATLTSGSTSCTADTPFTITIVPIPSLGATYNDVVACNSYTLPSISAGGYYSSPNGVGSIAAGTAITSTQVVYAYVSTTTGSTTCYSEDPFTVTIINSADTPQNVTACGSYTLPALSIGSYRTAANGTGSVIPAGTVITSTQTIYRYIPVTSGANCTNDDAFTVTITNTPLVDSLPDVTACNQYVLPALTNGNYFAGPGGTNNQYFANDVITSGMTMYIYNSNPGCSAESDFTITINQVSVPNIEDQVVCSNVGYTLPDLPSSSTVSYAYYTLPGGPSGGGTSLAPGTVITTDSTIYTYGALTNVTPTCYAEDSFTVTTVAPPVIDDFGVIAECSSVVLPALQNGGYFTGSGGTGNQMFPGQVVYQSTILYIYAATGGTPNCTSENQLQIIVNPEPPQSLSSCDSYVLPALPAGQHYYTSAGGASGGGIEIPAGTSVSNQSSYTGTYATDTDGNHTHQIYFFVDSAAACTQDTYFEVTINETPVLDAVSDVVLCDMYVLPALSVGNYYTLPGGASGGGQMLQAGDIITTTQDIYVYADTATFPNCVAEASFNVNITTTPNTIALSDVEICDLYQFSPLPAGYNYYLLSGGPNVPGQQLAPATLGPNAPDGTNIYIYSAAAGNPDCFMETSYNVIVYSIQVDSVYSDIMADYPWGYVEECDSYDLPDIDEGDDTFAQHYYQLPGGPDVAGQVEIPDTTVITSNTTVYLYARLLGRVNCEDEAQIDIVINQTPVVDDTQADFSDCFSHTLPALAVGNYYSSPGGVNQITDLTITASQQVYIYAQTGTNNICSDEHTFFLTINTIDVPDPADVVSCDDYTLPTPVPATARYFELPGGPNTGGQVEHLVGEVLTPGDYDLYVWDHTNTTPDCTDEEQFNIKVVARPVGIIPVDLTTCSTDDAGENGLFNLTASVAEAIGTQQNVAATVHETMADADFGVNAIADITNYQNVNDFNQTVYIRLYSTLASSCYTVVPLNLIVYPRPIATDPLDDYEVCDNGADDTDGIGVFDLTTYIPTVLGTMDPALHTVTFYPTLADLQNNSAIIGTPATYNTATTTVYVKVTINATGCYDVVALNLIVNPKPVVTNPTPLTLCDVNDFGDEVEEFDLTSKINEITGGVFGLDVTFHTTLADAEANTGAITNPTEYENTTPGVQPIFVRVTNAVTGCYRIVLLDIRVEPLPILTQPTVDDLTVCSTNATGYGNFDLNEIATQMIDGGVNMTVQFYYTYVSAINNFSAIANTANFQNNVQYNQTLYVVATNTITGCRSNVYTINLVVDPAPATVILQDLTQCDDLDSNGTDDHMIFDLTVQDAVIETQLGVAPGTYTIHYFTSQANAQNGSPRIIVPTAYYGANNQVIWVRIENPATECYIVTSFELKINQPQTLAHPANIILCDEALPNDNVTTFDLTIRNDDILTPTGIGEGNEVRFFVTQADRDANINWIVDPTQYTNISNPQTLYILVLTPEGCKSKENITIVVTPRPTPDTTPDALVLCDAVTIGDGIEVFDLTEAAADILDGDTQSVVQYYATAADVLAGTPITNPAAYSNVTPWDDTVIVVVTRTDTQPGSPGCAEEVTLPLHVDSLPPVYDPADPTHTPYYAICNSPTTGFETFYLMDFINNLLTAAGETPTNYDIRFYATYADIANGTALPHVYTNTTAGHQVIWVKIVNNTTDCELIAQMDLYAELAAIANPVTGANNPLTMCDYDGVNDGFTIFDLTPAGTEALGSQTPNYSVQYYTTQAAAIDGDTTAAEYIGDLNAPTAFTNTTNPQTLWIRVTNEGTLSRCYDVTSFDVQVELLAEPVISTADGSQTLCMDFDTNQPTDGPLVLNSGVPSTGYTFTWYLDGADVTTDPTENFYNAVAPGMYTVIATSDTALACVSNPSAQFEVIQSGPASLIGNGYTVSNAFSDEQTVVVLVEGYGEYQYTISPEGEDPIGPWQNSNVFENMPTGSFTVWIRDVKTDNPCDMVAIDGVSVIDYPNFFTPNGDGFNDYWNIVGLQNTDTQIFIFDRYGKLIKQLSPDSDGWDGTYNGNPLPADDYWFTVEYPDALGVRREFKSHFSLKR
ncbi:choice-of-anchor L domain-containing protein [Flavobacterium sp. RHBU_3]|uniref:choice-of-anchor L domain-containing protein n=1 Tax=Flavobacterium sp. RHBU_3 TaxID=3391184 RepID=UPI0039849BE4